MSERDLLGELRAREVRDAFERANGWAVIAYHVEMLRETWMLHGPFSEPAEALSYAASRSEEMLREGAEGFKFDVLPLMPSD